MQASAIAEYLEEVAKRLTGSGGLFENSPALAVDYNDDIGVLDGSLRFHDGSRLEVTIVAAGPMNFPDWLSYRFHYMDSEKACVFRYDNTGHHPGTAFFPHHKHTGPNERMSDHPRPSLSHILREIAQHLGSV